MFVTCPFCRKVFSIQPKTTNYLTLECVFCESSFSLNLNAGVEIGDGGIWVKSPAIEDIWEV